MRKCRAYDCDGGGILICCETEFSKNLLSREKSLGTIAAAASSVLERRITPNAVKVEVLPASEDPDAASLLASELGSLADGGNV